MKRAVRSDGAFTLLELLISNSICLFVLGAMITGAVAMQKCFVAQDDYATGKCDQLRLSDYLALDLRRALTITSGTSGSATILALTIPDYYDQSGQPRIPSITGNVVNYAATPVNVTYSKSGSSIFRTEGSSVVEIASNVTDFTVSVQDLEKVVKTQMTFAPRFSSPSSADARAATAVHNTTLLRNKRRDRS